MGVDEFVFNFLSEWVGDNGQYSLKCASTVDYLVHLYSFYSNLTIIPPNHF